MSDEKKPDSGASGGDGGADPKDQQKPDPKPKVVSFDDHKRALDDMHKFKREKEEIEKRLSDAEEKRLQDNQEWKTLAEQRQKKIDEVTTDNRKLTDTFVRTQKYTAVRNAALEMGLRAEAMDDLDLIDIDAVKVEATSSGRYLVHGAKEFAEELKGKKPHWFKKTGAPEVNGGTGGGAPGKAKKLTPTDLYQAERKMKAGMITKDDYTKLFKEYRGQSKTN